MEVLALSRGVADRPRVNRDTLQQDLSLECDGDLHIVLAFAEKIRPNTYIDFCLLLQLQHSVNKHDCITCTLTLS